MSKLPGGVIWIGIILFDLFAVYYWIMLIDNGFGDYMRGKGPWRWNPFRRR